LPCSKRCSRSILWDFIHALGELAADRVTVRFETPHGRHERIDVNPHGLVSAEPTDTDWYANSSR
jgi:hypothetical protein